jgi:hypothetical protein
MERISVATLLGAALRPRWNNSVHARICNQLAHMFVVMNDDAQVHAIYGGIFAHDLDLALKIARLELSASCFDCIK